MYYQRYGIDRIADLGLARHIFDQAINPGPGGTIKYLQEWINENTGSNLIVDGVIGSQSQKIINSLSEEQINKLHADLVKRRVQYYFNEANKDIEEKRKDKTKQKNVVYALKGYLNRTYDFARDKSNYLRDLEEAKRLQKIYSEIK